MKVVHPIEQYYPRIRQCYKCIKFKHVKSQCKSSKNICYSCEENEHPPGEEFQRKFDPLCYNCTGESQNCTGDHCATDKKMPFQERKTSETQQRDTIYWQQKSTMTSTKIRTKDLKYMNSHPQQPVTSQTIILINPSTERPRRNVCQYHQGTKDKNRTQKRNINLKNQKKKKKSSQAADSKGQLANQKKSKCEEIRKEHKGFLLAPNGRSPSSLSSEATVDLTKKSWIEIEIEQTQLKLYYNHRYSKINFKKSIITR